MHSEGSQQLPLMQGKFEKTQLTQNAPQHTGQCKSTGGCYNELVVAYFSTGGGVKWRKR